MKKLLIVIGCLAAGAAEARQRNLARPAPSQFADTEATTNVPCRTDHPSLREWGLGLELVGTPSNNVVVTVGHDGDRDGALSPAEQSVVFGWDCGEWIAFGPGGEIELTCEGPDTNGIVRAAFAVGVRRHRANPSWLYSDTWDLVNVTRRGVDDAQERVSIYTRIAGTQILVR